MSLRLSLTLDDFQWTEVRRREILRLNRSGYGDFGGIEVPLTWLGVYIKEGRWGFGMYWNPLRVYGKRVVGISPRMNVPNPLLSPIGTFMSILKRSQFFSCSQSLLFLGRCDFSYDKKSKIKKETRWCGRGFIDGSTITVFQPPCVPNSTRHTGKLNTLRVELGRQWTLPGN